MATCETLKMAVISEEIHTKICQFFGITTLREHQTAALERILVHKQDTLIVLPCGMGKSLCFEAMTLANELLHQHSNTMVKDIVLVVSPLKILMDMQIQNLKEHGIPAVSVANKAAFKDIEHGKYRYVIGNPEEFLTDKEALALMQKHCFRERVLCLVFDEVHTAISWGHSQGGKEAFRQYFSRVGDLRSFFPGVPMMGLTATASKQTQSKITGLLCMRDTFAIVGTPNRSNIYMHVEKVPANISSMDWLVDMLDTEDIACPRTIIYCRSYNDCSDLYRYFLSAFGPNPTELDCRRFDMVHSKTNNKVKHFVQNALQQDDTPLKLVIATKVIGMGLDIKVDLVVHYGVPTSVEDYLQQIGRSGRSGQQAHATMLYNGKQLRNVEPEMLAVIKGAANGKCIRKLALKDFGVDKEATTVEPLHKCCSECKASCECLQCDKTPYEQFKMTDQSATGETEFCRSVDTSTLENLKIALSDLKNDLDRDMYLSTPVYSNPEQIHGLDFSMVKLLSEKSDKIFSVDDIIEKCGLTIYTTACAVVHVFSDFFSDMDADIQVNEDFVYE